VVNSEQILILYSSVYSIVHSSSIVLDLFFKPSVLSGLQDICFNMMHS
jgi:hypothetical protein